jgi:DNA-binding NtrC family response regulator
VLQERHFFRVGGTKPAPVNVRVIAASNEDLKSLVEEGSFRRDLFYRLNVIRIEVPPLRARRPDIPPLARHFVDRSCEQNRLPVKELSQEAMKVLMSYDWPGNVRELENAMEYATVVSGQRIRILGEDLPPELSERPAGLPLIPPVTEEGVDLRRTLSGIERELLLQSLEIAGGNKARAASLLNIKRTTFVEKLKRANLAAENR